MERGPGDNPVDCWISGAGRAGSELTGGGLSFLLEDEYLFEYGHAIGRDGQKHSLIFTLQLQQAKRENNLLLHQSLAPAPAVSVSQSVSQYVLIGFHCTGLYSAVSWPQHTDSSAATSTGYYCTVLYWYS